MEYGKIFSRAWNICWNHKFLFLLGFLAILGTGGSGSSGNANYSFDQQDLPFAPNGTVSPEFAQNIEQLLTAAIPIFIGLACAGVFIGASFTVIYAYALGRSGVAFQCLADGTLMPKTIAIRRIADEAGPRAMLSGLWRALPGGSRR